MKNTYQIPFNGMNYLARTITTTDGCLLNIATLELWDAIEEVPENSLELIQEGQFIDLGIVYYTTPEEMLLPDLELEKLIYN